MPVVATKKSPVFSIGVTFKMVLVSGRIIEFGN